MGAWGVTSTACDDVQDELFVFQDKDGRIKRWTLDQLSKRLNKIKVDKSYNPTLLHGVIVELVEHGQVPLNSYVKKAVEQATEALNDKEYIKSWKNPKKRVEALRSEIRMLKKYLPK